MGRRRKGPFVAVNCAAVVEPLLEAELFGIEERTATGVRGRRGKFEHADGGTLFLDEVSDLALSAQRKLLRAIQDLAIERVGTGSRRVDSHVSQCGASEPLTQHRETTALSIVQPQPAPGQFAPSAHDSPREGRRSHPAAPARAFRAAPARSVCDGITG